MASSLRKILPVGNDVLALIVHEHMERHCTCGFHSDDPEQHGPSHWSERPCVWRKMVERSNDHVAMVQATVERGPIAKLNDAGHVLMLPPGATPQDLIDFKKWRDQKEYEKNNPKSADLSSPTGPAESGEKK